MEGLFVFIDYFMNPQKKLYINLTAYECWNKKGKLKKKKNNTKMNDPMVWYQCRIRYGKVHYV